MMLRAVLLGLLAHGVVGAGVVHAKTTDFLDAKMNVKSSYAIPTDRLIMMELDNGEIILATGDGKYIIKNASVFSTIHTKFVNTPDELHKSTRVNVTAMRLKPETQLAGFTINEEAEEFGGTLFVSPSGCDHCAEFIEQLKTQQSDKRFMIAIAPVLQESDYKEVIAAQCSSEPTAAFNAMFEGRFSQVRFPAFGVDNCKGATEKVNYTIAALQMLSFGRVGLPSFFNNEDGVIVGLPKDDSHLNQVIIQGLQL
ncbi:hypothetical protein ACRZ5S_22425 (plasmid) [Vibrio scophthalmi]|uniref:hypothetical protein n=1 Tax=Vibrio scophthalmi TaxID=45658 RepID=UPI003EB6E973